MAEFTQDWANKFSVKEHWATYLSPLAGRPLRMLEVGCYEGQSALWFLENVLTHKDCRLVCVDTFKGDPQLWEMGVDFDGLIGRFFKNIEPYLGKVQVHPGQSRTVLKYLGEHFNLAYIDGSHYQVDVLRDAVLAFDLLVPGGLLILDDYKMEYPGYDARMAIDAFLAVYCRDLEVLHVDWQVIVRKK